MLDVSKTILANNQILGQYRPVIIDGSSMGFAFANHEKFCAEGIRVAYECFKCLGYEDDNIIIILKHIPEHYKSGHDQAIIDFYHKLGILYYCPSRYVFFWPRASIAEAVLRMTLLLLVFLFLLFLLLLTNFYHSKIDWFICYLFFKIFEK